MPSNYFEFLYEYRDNPELKLQMPQRYQSPAKEKFKLQKDSLTKIFDHMFGSLDLQIAQERLKSSLRQRIK
jgi:hypothetical protein